MKTYEKKMVEYIRKHHLLTLGDRVLIGCSGGIDSLVLVHFLKMNERTFGITVSAVHVDHMLRGEESRRDRNFTEETCRHWKVPCFSRGIPIPDILETAGGNKQQVCRDERYAYFNEVMAAEGAQKFATAHHADDQLETVLMAGMRGSLQSGLFGMPLRRPFGEGELIRPQFAVTKDEIVDYALCHGIVHREDPSNAEPIYTRNRVREAIVPLLKKEEPSVSSHFVELAETMQEDQRFLEGLAHEEVLGMVQWTDGRLCLSAESFRSGALALQKRMVLILLNYLYNGQQVSITKQLAEQVQNAMQGSAGTVFLHLPHDYMMTRQYDAVFFSRQPLNPATATGAMPITGDWSESVKGFRYKRVPLLQVEKEENAVIWYFTASVHDRLIIRSRKPGDRINLAGMQQPKKVARLMIDEKVPVCERENWPVIATEKDDVLLIPGLRPSSLVSREPRAGDDWVLIEQHENTQKENY
ncbi:MAG TPA: tRNA lysidine(34) synthetase TilS [Planococcus sp. (in: firmicutes)]|nr:tRNA lysidine(34) synthetase TilS [Planococcus sp. (in: firmicutes)]